MFFNQKGVCAIFGIFLSFFNMKKVSNLLKWNQNIKQHGYEGLNIFFQWCLNHCLKSEDQLGHYRRHFSISTYLRAYAI